MNKDETCPKDLFISILTSGQGCETGVTEGNRPHVAVSALAFVVEVQV